MVKSNEILVGERWAYRARSIDDLVEVEVTAVGEHLPARIEIVFMNGDLAGSKAWIQPGRLKVFWSARAPYLRLEEQWHALVSSPSDIEWEAVDAIFREFLRPAADINWLKSKRGTVTVIDDEFVDVFIGGGLREVASGVNSISDPQGKTYGWSIAVALAQRVCSAKPTLVMAYVHSIENNGRSSATGGAHCENFPQPQPQPQPTASGIGVATQYFDEVIRPTCDLIRSWCGKPAADLEDELILHRNEAHRFEDLFVDAVALLSDMGDEEASWAIYRLAYPDAQKNDWQANVDQDTDLR